nr:class I SAM-dependent methyltransferase [Mesorhizobium sp.]
MATDERGALASAIRQRSAIKDPESKFFQQSGPKAAETIFAHLRRHVSKPSPSVLDFGCASGRVLLPLAKLAPDWSFSGCDVDAEAVEYVSLSAPTIAAKQNGYAPPAPFPDRSFDAVYAVSVWSHFPENIADAWLDDIARLLKPGGVALITTAGPSLLEFVQNTFRQWADVTAAEIDRTGFVFRELGNLHSHQEQFPGIDASWGNTIITERYIREKWSDRFDVIEHIPRGMNGQQDITILRGPA